MEAPMPHSPRRPIGDLLAEATAALADTDPADTQAVLTALWRGFCVAGAVGAILAICSDDPDYRVLSGNAEPVLAAAIGPDRHRPGQDSARQRAHRGRPAHHPGSRSGPAG
jgi:hypothetical protein